MRPPASIDIRDDLGRARRALKASGLGALPVTVGDRVVGLLSEQGLVERVRGGGALRRSGQEADGVSRALHADRREGWCELTGGEPPFAVSGALGITEALALVADLELPILAVTDPGGKLCGVVARGDLLGASAGDLRPVTLGGLATPLGVYLTTGDVRGGAGDLGLVLAGAALMGLNLLVAVGLDLASARVPLLAGDLGLMVFVVAFFVLLRFTPLARIHAAEHQVVHASERGESLALERVRLEPREHPRCGTNLAAVALAAQAMLPRLLAAPELATAAAIVLFFTWRDLGRFLQRHFTTRRAADRHILGALGSAEVLLARYNARPNYRAPLWRRLWNTGVVQIASGGLMVYWAFEALAASRL